MAGNLGCGELFHVEKKQFFLSIFFGLDKMVKEILIKKTLGK